MWQIGQFIVLGEPGAYLRGSASCSLCVGPRQKEEELLCGLLIFQICVYETHSVPS